MHGDYEYRHETEISEFTNHGSPLSYAVAASVAMQPFNNRLPGYEVKKLRNNEFAAAADAPDAAFARLSLSYSFERLVESHKRITPDGYFPIGMVFDTLLQWARADIAERYQEQGQPNEWMPWQEPTFPPDFSNRTPIIRGLQDIERHEDPSDSFVVVHRQLRIMGFHAERFDLYDDPSPEELEAGHFVVDEPIGEPFSPIIARATALLTAYSARLYHNNDLFEAGKHLADPRINDNLARGDS
jgi:hypothetical protein